MNSKISKIQSTNNAASHALNERDMSKSQNRINEKFSVKLKDPSGKEYEVKYFL